MHVVMGEGFYVVWGAQSQSDMSTNVTIKAYNVG